MMGRNRPGIGRGKGVGADAGHESTPWCSPALGESTVVRSGAVLVMTEECAEMDIASLAELLPEIGARPGRCGARRADRAGVAPVRGQVAPIDLVEVGCTAQIPPDPRSDAHAR